ncbi:MAG TPA: hypothetical protein VGZ71_15740 [Puia sp.]|jgi:hypothetical protein|nr:hypothetical protein [Puia sp.]
MLRKYFKQKISRPAREKGWILGEKFGKIILPGALFLCKLFNSLKKKAERNPRLTVSLLLMLIILNTMIAVDITYHRNKSALKPESKTSSIQGLKVPKAIDMDMLNSQVPDIGRLKAIRDSLQFFKDKSSLTSQDSITILGLLKVVATLNKNYKHP